MAYDEDGIKVEPEASTDDIHGFKCPVCGHFNEEDDYYGQTDGEELDEECSKCGQKIKVTVSIVTEYWYHAEIEEPDKKVSA